MILKSICRKFCVLSSNQMKTKQNFKSIYKLFSKNSKQIKIFNELIETQELKLLRNIFVSNGYQLRFAGGLVRDLLSGTQPKDIDLSSNATPDQMKTIISGKTNVWILKTSSGRRHGTVTVRVNDRQQYEINALHKWSDGRPGQLVFVNDWKTDASCRDLTINAMYLSFDGILYDYFDGLNDLSHKVIRFVGPPEEPIHQNVITIFRYFRFHSQFSAGATHDPQILSTIKSHCKALDQTNSQKIWTEMKKILVLSQCLGVFEVMFNELEIGKYLGFSHNWDSNHNLSHFRSVLSNLTNGLNDGLIDGWEASTLLAALIPDCVQLSSVSKRLQLSNSEKSCIRYVIKNRELYSNLDLNALKTQLVLVPKDQQNNLQKCFIECLKYCGLSSHIQTITECTKHDFPFTGDMFSQRINNKNLLKQVINDLKIFWLKSDFKCTEDELKRELDFILEKKGLNN